MSGFFRFTKKWKIALPVLFLIGAPTAILRNTDNGIANMIISILICVVVFITPLALDIIYYLSPAEKSWGKWKDVSGVKADMRKDRAKNGEVTPLHVYPEIKAAVFAGSTGGKYRTTLKKCSCPDFQKRGVPCKHMYYLADKCGLNK